MTRDDVQRWLDAYVDAWRTYDRGAIGDLFAEDVPYRYQPYRDPVVGRDAIVADWLGRPGRGGLLGGALRAVRGRWRPRRGGRREPLPRGGRLAADVFYNVWLLRFDGEGRCAEFVEYWRELPEELREGR